MRDAIEHLGVGIVISKRMGRYVKDIQQISARNICITLTMQAGDLDIISTYAPQASSLLLGAQCFAKHYHELMEILGAKYSFSPKIVLGDFNARIIKALPYERDVIGPYTLGASDGSLDSLSEAQFQNRLNFTEFCLTNDLSVRNTFCQKSEAQLVTYKSVGVKGWKAPWHLHKYAQMDYILINNEWKNAITNVSTSCVHTVETDHKLMMANFNSS